MPKKSFGKVLRGIMDSLFPNKTFRFSQDALDCLQTAAEAGETEIPLHLPLVVAAPLLLEELWGLNRFLSGFGP